MISKTVGKEFLGDTALIDGGHIDTLAYCNKSVSRISNSSEPFIIFHLKGTDGNIIQAFLYNVSTDSGYSQQSLTHSYVNFAGRVSSYGGRTVIILDAIVKNKDVTESDMLRFKQSVGEQRIESMSDYLQKMLGSVTNEEVVSATMKSFALDSIDNGRVGAPLEMLYTVVKNLATRVEPFDNNIKVSSIYGGYVTTRKYLTYLSKKELGVMTPSQIATLIASVNSNIEALNPYIVDTLSALIYDTTPKSFQSLLIYDEVTKYIQFINMKRDWDTLLSGNELLVKYGTKNIPLSKY